MQGDRIAAIGAIRGTATREIDASSLAVAPGFINMLSWATESLLEDASCVGTAYFILSEENLAKKIRQPAVAFGSDAGSMAPEGVFLESNPHPRAYGTFARLLGHYVREQKVISPPEAIRRLTALPVRLNILAPARNGVGFPPWNAGAAKSS